MAVETLSLTSRESFMGAALRVRVQAERQEDGNYKIARDEWDRTFGPVMERATNNIVRDNRRDPDQDSLMCVSHGYNAMTSEQTRGFHSLMQAFSTAADKNYANHLGGDYKQKMLDFAQSYDDGNVIVSGTQMAALTTMARAAVTFARKDTEYQKVDSFWKAHVDENPAMKYRTGILGRFL